MTPEPTATPAVRAREAEHLAQGDVCELIAAYAEAWASGDRTATKAKLAFSALDAYRDAVAARVTAELLAGGTPLWVATDRERELPDPSPRSVVFREQPEPDEDGDWCTDGPMGVYGEFLNLPCRLTPPGTVRQAVLLIPEATDG